VFTDFGDVSRPESFAPLPQDWHVVMSDVRNSSVAVQSGRYKYVNTLGAATITAVLSAAGGVDIPFVFEGDGSVLCVPPELLDAARAALLRTQELARRSFDLELRIAALPVARIREAGFTILVARYRVSDNDVQAVFAGGGIAYADHMMKDPATAPSCAVLPGTPEARAASRVWNAAGRTSQPARRDRERDGEGARARPRRGRGSVPRGDRQGAGNPRCRRRPVPRRQGAQGAHRAGRNLGVTLSTNWQISNGGTT
jgi:hypothetical protein